jgi:hypothetical protein
MDERSRAYQQRVHACDPVRVFTASGTYRSRVNSAPSSAAAMIDNRKPIVIVRPSHLMSHAIER